MESTLRAVAASQHGTLSWAQVRRAGISPGELGRYVARGEVVRVRRGAFVMGDIWREADADRRYALTTRAVLLSRPGDAASHHAAFALSGLPLWGLDVSRVDVQANVTRRRAPSGLRLHPWDPRARREIVAGARSLTIAEAAPLVAATGCVDGAVVALDAAVSQRLCTVEQVTEVVARLEKSATVGIARARRLAELIDPTSESPGESRLRLLLVVTGLAVRTQVHIYAPNGRLVGRVDFLVDDGVIVEFDGRVKYGNAAALWDEKRREDALRSLGYEMVRVVWADLDQPERIASLIRAARARAARRGR